MCPIDIHAHLQFPQFDRDREEVIRRTEKAGIGVVNVGTDLETSRGAIILAEKYLNMWAAVGLHPTDVAGGFDEVAFRELAQHPKVVAVGECGLEIREGKSETEDWKKQPEIFEAQIQLASEVKKPLMLHIRNAYRQVLEILISNSGLLNSGYPGNVHFFSGDWPTAKKFLDLGFSLSFSGVITFPPKAGQPRADVLDEVVKKIPLEMIFVETDCPFAAPRPWRGQRNEPCYLAEVLRRVATLRRITEEAFGAAVIDNARRLFHLPLA